MRRPRTSGGVTAYCLPGCLMTYILGQLVLSWHALMLVTDFTRKGVAHGSTSAEGMNTKRPWPRGLRSDRKRSAWRERKCFTGADGGARKFWTFLKCKFAWYGTFLCSFRVYYLPRQQLWGQSFHSNCLSVFLHDITKTYAARITKLDAEILHDESWKPIYFGSKRSKAKVTSHKALQACVFALLWVLASSRIITGVSDHYCGLSKIPLCA